MNIKITLKGDIFTIHIDDLPHLYICSPIISFQAWSEQNKFFKIEYKTKHQSILTEYDCIEKWTAILKELDKIFTNG